MRLTFDRTGVERLLDILRHATKFRHPYSSEFMQEMGMKEEEPVAKLWLVGDQGVYVMANNIRPEGEKAFVVYAAEVDPTKMEFDAWWNAKRASFGGDDGVEQLDPDAVTYALSTALPGRPLQIDMTPQTYRIISRYRLKPVLPAVPDIQILGLDDPGTVFNAIASALGEPPLEQSGSKPKRGKGGRS